MKATIRPVRLWVRLAAMFGLLASIGANRTADAHEVRPAYLQLTESTSGTFDVLLKTPMLGDLRLSLGVGFSPSVEAVTPVLWRRTEDAMVQTWRVHPRDGLAGQRLRIVGLENTVSDALVRVEFA